MTGKPSLERLQMCPGELPTDGVQPTVQSGKLPSKAGTHADLKSKQKLLSGRFEGGESVNVQEGLTGSPTSFPDSGQTKASSEQLLT